MARLKKGKDGYYRTSITINGQRYPVIGKTQKEIEDKKHDIRSAVDANHPVKTSTMLMRDYADNWFNSFQKNRNPNTRDMYYYTIYKHIIPSIGSLPISRITRSDIQAMIDERWEHPETCQKIMNSCRQMFEDMIDDGLILSNPCRRRKINMPKIIKKETPPLSDKELHAIVNADVNKMERAYLNCLLAFGVRRSEALGLMKNDFDFDASVVHFQRSITFDKNNPVINPYMKTDFSRRDMYIPNTFLDFFKSYVDSCTGLYLFTKKDGTLMTQSAYTKMWQRITKALNQYLLSEAEIKMKQEPARRITALTFRHDFATQLYYSDISRKKAVEMMGHAGGQMIEKVYASLDAQKEKAEEKIDKLHNNRMAN